MYLELINCSSFMIQPELILLMGNRIDQEVAMSRRDKEIETEAAWQAHYIQWGLIMGIIDPCGHQRGYQHIVAIYVGYLTSEVNFRNKSSLRSNTIKGYATVINSLFTLRGMEAPIVLSDPNNMAGILINNLIKEEDIARQCSPLDRKSMPRCFEGRTYLVRWIWNSAPYSTSPPLVATLVLA
jgi:hypothetical protein